MPDADPRDWRARAWQRLRSLFWLKALGITAFIWLFFVAYFALLHHPSRPPSVVPSTALDEFIGLQPAAFWPYASLWVYVGIAPGLLQGFRALAAYGLWAAALCLSGLAFFYFMPTAVPPPPVRPDPTLHPGFALLQGLDAPGNALPSLHVATSLFTALWIARSLREIGAPAWLGVLNALWLVLIVYATLATKQHLVLDALAGAALGALFAGASIKSAPLPQRCAHGL